MPRLEPFLMAASLSLVVTASAASAQSCGEVADRLAEQYSLEAAPPAGSPEEAMPPEAADGGEEVTPQELAQSGGVIQPPPTGDAAVIEPPPVASDMPTAPPVEPQPPGTDQSHTVKSQLEAVLSAAKAAAEEGDEEACRERLAEAEALVQQLSPR